MARPAKYKTPEEMQIKIKEYFAKCEAGKSFTWVNKRGEKQEHTIGEPPDWGGLALYLGFASRQSLNDYLHRKKTGNENRDIELPNEDEISFAYILTRAKTQIEVAKKTGAILGMYESRMIDTDLKANHGYSDIQKHEITGKNGIPLTLFPKPGEYTMVEWMIESDELAEAEKVKKGDERAAVSVNKKGDK